MTTEDTSYAHSDSDPTIATPRNVGRSMSFGELYAALTALMPVRVWHLQVGTWSETSGQYLQGMKWTLYVRGEALPSLEATTPERLLAAYHARLLVAHLEL